MTGLLELYRDETLLAVVKPSGMAVHRGWARDRVTAADLARDLCVRPVHALHRLDRGTSGVLLFALSADAARAASAAFESGAVEKQYLALVRGPAPDALHIDHPIPRKEGGPRVPAVTDVRTLGHFERYSLVEAMPRTGRLHQVRRHLKHVSLPIIGDSKYGKGEHNRLLRDRFGLARLALHAASVTLPHPATGASLTLVAPVPEDLAEPLRRMGFGELLARPQPRDHRFERQRR